MNTDIRLLVSFKGHLKRRRLERILGARSSIYLVDLWLSVAQSKPDGVLTGWDEVDIADASGYDGNAIEYAEALVQAGWLEKDSETYSVHGWCEHQVWASKAQIRSDAARFAAERRWLSKQKHLTKCGRNARAMRNDAEGNAPSPIPSPSPSPIPSPLPTPKHKLNGVPCPYQKIIQSYHQNLPSNPQAVSLPEAVLKTIKQRWREDKNRQTIEWWDELFRWIADSEFLTGKSNDFIADLIWIVKATNLSKILGGRYHHKNKFKELPVKTQQNISAAAKAQQMVMEGKL